MPVVVELQPQVEEGALGAQGDARIDASRRARIAAIDERQRGRPTVPLIGKAVRGTAGVRTPADGDAVTAVGLRSPQTAGAAEDERSPQAALDKGENRAGRPAQ